MQCAVVNGSMAGDSVRQIVGERRATMVKMRVLRSDMQHACRLAARPLPTTNAVAYTRSGLLRPR